MYKRQQRIWMDAIMIIFQLTLPSEWEHSRLLPVSYTHLTECDAIIMDNGKVEAIPSLAANDIDAALIHEAAIGKIAGEQLIKLMTLGLSEKEAEEQIVNGFLK